ncbi:FAS1-like dehydratase domain-containing protein [Streptomyces gilvus]|uniref:FAS1-like dehydratase domain-containing protein n=1 Tax=Streptomyces gilvus TaxID=2920937 RepID=UPI001F10FD24|nr:MaoC family dehydratase N-terminal domain-containing protein [Streptomyces sp. CME 23]MCH5677570.1 MaoC family dehydratase N-terminal domain-containing protein [Streptomyces sp. CME 23]
MVGRTGEPFEFPVELGKIREFARAVASRDVAYTDGSVTPPTFLMAADLWQSRANSPWGDHPRALARTLHAEQEFVFTGPPPAAGTTLRGQSRIDRRYTKHGRRGGTMTFTEVVTEYRDEQDRVIAEVRSTTVETSKAART